ncbi:hypothetical protein [Serratia sp. S4]|uniref:hypothetical protein n=1 Tax=Serratia sp. S4 TaxID=768491 RepID=UPI00039F86A2|nr:hypothetical protein [Serratia sp. S4]
MNGKMWIDIKTKREVRLFLWMVRNDVAFEYYRQTKEIKTYHLNHIYGEDCNLAVLAINEAFRILYKDSDDLFSYAYRLKKAKEALLPTREFSWFKRSNDACYFAWAYIRVFSNKNRSLSNFGDNETLTIYTRTPYHRYINIQYPVSHRERIECIEDFFDRSPMDLSSKLSIMSDIRYEWDRHSPLAIGLPLKKNEKEKINWAWDYICKDKINYITGSIKRAQEKIIEESGGDKTVSQATLDEIYYSCMNGYIHQPHFLSLFRPSTTTEKYLALRCIYISLYYYDKKFISRFKKSWESSSYRKAKRKSNSTFFKKIKSELISGEKISEASGPSEEETVKTEKDILREKAHEVMEKVMKNIENKNSDLSDEQDNDTSEHHSGANPWFG